MSYLVRSYTAEGHRSAAAWPREAKRRPARSKILPHRRFRSLRRRRRRSRLSSQPKATGRSRATRCSCPSPPTAHRERLVGGNLFLSRERVASKQAREEGEVLEWCSPGDQKKRVLFDVYASKLYMATEACSVGGTI